MTYRAPLAFVSPRTAQRVIRAPRAMERAAKPSRYAGVIKQLDHVRAQQAPAPQPAATPSLDATSLVPPLVVGLAPCPDAPRPPPACWSALSATDRARVTRGLGRLEAALVAWARAKAPQEPSFGDSLFSAIAGGFDLTLTYDVDALALVHRSRDPALALPPEGHPSARTLLAALRTPGAKVQFTGDRLVLLAPTARTQVEHLGPLAAASRNRVVGGPLLPGVRSADVWYDGTSALDLDALVRDASPARRRVVERAAAMVSHRWQARPANTHHGLGADGVWTDTPDETFIAGGFARRGENIGLPYFWGGFSDVAAFDRGIAAGLPAGHIFAITPTFREDNPFTPLGVGVDCSGFVSQAWELETKAATGWIEENTVALPGYADLEPGDVVMKVWQHVMLFVGRRDDTLLFMESTPPRCIGLAYTPAQLEAMHMLPRAARWLG